MLSEDSIPEISELFSVLILFKVLFGSPTTELICFKSLYSLVAIKVLDFSDIFGANEISVFYFSLFFYSLDLELELENS